MCAADFNHVLAPIYRLIDAPPAQAMVARARNRKKVETMNP